MTVQSMGKRRFGQRAGAVAVAAMLAFSTSVPAGMAWADLTAGTADLTVAADAAASVVEPDMLYKAQTTWNKEDGSEGSSMGRHMQPTAEVRLIDGKYDVRISPAAQSDPMIADLTYGDQSLAVVSAEGVSPRQFQLVVDSIAKPIPLGIAVNAGPMGLMKHGVQLVVDQSSMAKADPALEADAAYEAPIAFYQESTYMTDGQKASMAGGFFANKAQISGKEGAYTVKVTLGATDQVTFEKFTYGADNAEAVATKNANGSTTYEMKLATLSDIVKVGFTYTPAALGRTMTHYADLSIKTALVTEAQPAVETQWKRLAGKTALDTMSEIVKEGFEKSDTVVVATAGGYWDALAASALAGAQKAPILLTDGKALSSQTKQQIERLGATKAIVCGGESAVSTDVESALKAMKLDVKRLGGKTAIETAELISTEALATMGSSNTCVIATINGFYDSLSIAPGAYALGMPVYLTMKDNTLADSTIAAIKKAGYANAVIVGGESAVASAAEKQLAQAGVRSITRLGGNDAWETSQKIADWELSRGMVATATGVADGVGYWDALCGAALCGKNNSPLVLVPHDDKATGFKYDPYCIDHFVKSNADTIATGYVFGGEKVVMPSTLEALVKATA